MQINKKNKKLLIVSIVFILFISIVVLAYTSTYLSTKFNNGLVAENLTFTGDENITRYLNLSKFFIINSARINLTGFNNSALCYQETANVQTDCGGLDTGEYSLDTADESSIDGDWNTFDDVVKLYVNYSKPVGALNTSLWLFKTWTYTGNPSKQVILKNTSIDSDCWQQEPLQLYLQGVDGSDAYFARCYDGSEWITLSFGASPGDSGGARIYEEAMWWNISSILNNTYLQVGPDNDTNYEWNVTGRFNYTNYTVDHSTSINDYLTNCTYNQGFCLVPYLFHSSSAGLLQVHNININYTPAYNLTALTITPSTNLYTDDNLNCSVTTDSSSQDLNVSFYWYVDDVINYSYSSNKTCEAGTTCYTNILFDNSDLVHFNNLTCSVIAGYNSGNWSNEINSSWRIISNTLPTISKATFNDTVITNSEDVNCTYTGTLTDLDGDSLAMNYDWLNSTDGFDFFSTNFNTSVLNNTNTSSGQRWQCRIWIADGYNYSINYTSGAIEIDLENQKPEINDVNVTTNGLISNSATPTNNNSYLLFGINWTDPDGDNATIKICKTDSFTNTDCTDGGYGTEINSTTNIIYINYTLGNLTSGVNTVYIFAQDNNTLPSASKSVDFEINLPPTVAQTSPSDGTPFANSVTSRTLRWTASDDNSDSIRYIVYADQNLDPITNKTNTTDLNYLFSGLGPGFTYYWKVQATDEHGYSINTTIWDFSIAPEEGGGGGGGGGGEDIDEQALIEAARTGLCGNKNCEEGENLFNCPQDCQVLAGWNLDDLLCTGERCLWQEAGFASWMFFIIAGAIVFGYYQKNKK